jgi:hypothetical protein
MKSLMKKYFVEFKEINDGKEYFINSVKETDNIEETIKTSLENWYDSEDVEENNGVYEFFGGSIVVKEVSHREITDEEFEVLSRFI